LCLLDYAWTGASQQVESVKFLAWVLEEKLNIGKAENIAEWKAGPPKSNGPVITFTHKYSRLNR